MGLLQKVINTALFRIHADRSGVQQYAFPEGGVHAKGNFIACQPKSMAGKHAIFLALLPLLNNRILGA
jgi:hypothetical protein